MQNEFLTEKKRVKLWLSRCVRGWSIHEGTIFKEELPDWNIIDMVSILNNLPFLYTVGSCGGHIRSACGYFFFVGSWVTFVIRNNRRSNRFLIQLRKIIQGDMGASLGILPSGVYALVLSPSSAHGCRRDANSKIADLRKLKERITRLACSS